MAQFLLLKAQTASDGIHLDSANVRGGIEYLISKGILSAQRGREILA